MSVRYDEPHGAAKVANTLIRWLAEAGISIAGTRALRVRGRKTGQVRSVVVNVLTVGDVDYLVSPRGNTQWARNVRAAGAVEVGPSWRRRSLRATEVADTAKPDAAEALPGQVVLGGQGPHRRPDSGFQRRPVQGRGAIDPGLRADGRRLDRWTADADVLADLLGRRLPRHCRREAAPDAVEDADDPGGSGAAGQVDRPAGVALLADRAVSHGEPAVVDGFDGPATLAA